jgi:hypothetical protein
LNQVVPTDSVTDEVRHLMTAFARSTGLEPVTSHPRRYLWTDAFAVCNFLELFDRTGDDAFRALALRLVDQVHHTLGRHREDDERRGWISGLSEEEGEKHPNARGLRIGKPLGERRADEAPDEEMEWEQDGQYYHYLTKWMHAVSRVSSVTGDPTYLRWAFELARAAHARFAYAPRPGAARRLYWKMSIDLSRPLVPAMGQHDALDGFVTYSELQAVARHFPSPVRLDLRAEIADMASICQGGSWVTDDALGIGSLLIDAGRIAQLDRPPSRLLGRVLGASLPGLQAMAEGDALGLPADHRLAFRELGLSIGLRAVRHLDPTTCQTDPNQDEEPLDQALDAIALYQPLADQIEAFWMDEKHRTGTWCEHEDINMVMLATSLAPTSFLTV